MSILSLLLTALGLQVLMRPSLTCIKGTRAGLHGCEASTVSHRAISPDTSFTGYRGELIHLSLVSYITSSLIYGHVTPVSRVNRHTAVLLSSRLHSGFGYRANNVLRALL